ncbi:hypothetical protein U8C31_27560 (plasmid) [Sinorhizobium medicae]|uniref:hypothetical protein n=1 Tax=Sinorhizobium medicae TaxID=110321 RepID=UPI002AF6B3D5|nr:hypothetical protein [Sinorhizobium medicae]WQO75901.1 hypothetical protein U8C31_27560 [Sinorhizobium medicae]
MDNTGGDSSDSSPEQSSEADVWIAGLRGDDLASSRWSRHSTASQEEPITRQPKKEKKGWRSKLKDKLSSVKKAFVPSSGKKSSKDWTPEPEAIVETTFHVHYHKAVTPAATTADANLIECAATVAERRGYSKKTIKDNLTYLRALSNELYSFGGLYKLSDEELWVYVDAHYPAEKKECSSRRKNFRRALLMLKHYREVGDGGPQVKRGAPRHVASPEDDALINEASEYAVAGGRYTQTTVDIYARSLRNLSEKLRYKNQTITRLQDAALRVWVADLDLDRNSMQAGLGMLELYRQAQRGNNSLVTYSRAPMDAGGSFQPFPWQLVTPQSQIGPSSGLAIGPYSNTSGRYDDSQQNQQDGSQQNWGEQLAAGLFGNPSNAYAAYSNPPQIDPFSNDPQQIAGMINELMGGVNPIYAYPPQINPSSDSSQQNWQQKEFNKRFGSPLTPATPDYVSTQNELPPPPPDSNPSFVQNPRWVPANLPDLGEAAGSGWRHYSDFAPDGLSNALRERGLMPGWNQQTRFLINQQLYTAELRPDGRLYLTFQFGAWLGDREWLWEDHIRRDFELISREVQINHPRLAAITGLADPSQVPMLLGPGRDTARRYMARNLYGHENAANFVFIPVSNADPLGDPDRRGTHWSLLLLNRSDRDSPPVAYHFDSANGFNIPTAERIADSLLATEVIQMEMTEQQNGRDCGVFLLEAARALIERLAQGQSLNLTNLAPDRRALQARLRDPRADNS